MDKQPVREPGVPIFALRYNRFKNFLADVDLAGKSLPLTI